MESSEANADAVKHHDPHVLADYNVPGAKPGIGEEAEQYEQVVDIGPGKQNHGNCQASDERGDHGWTRSCALMPPATSHGS